MEDDRFNAGTLVHFDFSMLGGTWPEMTGRHPAIVISPRRMQKAGSVVIVPLSSSEARNANNANAVELTTESVVATTQTGRSFAICNLPVAISLDRRTLTYFETRGEGRNRGKRHKVSSQDLRAIRIAVLKNILDPRIQFPAVEAALDPSEAAKRVPRTEARRAPTDGLARLDRIPLVTAEKSSEAAETPRQSAVLQRLAKRILERRLMGNRPLAKSAQTTAPRLYLASAQTARGRYGPAVNAAGHDSL
ncbi:MAG: type II toxin-antitoxin system PemK/MazF family toxin [Pseudomonadota bacterium]